MQYETVKFSVNKSAICVPPDISKAGKYHEVDPQFLSQSPHTKTFDAALIPTKGWIRIVAPRVCSGG